MKIHRYINEIPKSVIEMAKEMNFPIITLNYDANLSILFNNILSEIQVRDYSTYSIDESYSKLLKNVYEAPTTKALVDAVEKIEGLDLLVKNIDTKTTHYSSDQILAYYNKHKKTDTIMRRVDSMIYYSEIIVYEEKPIYQMVFLAKNDRRHMLHNYIEIFKLLIIVIYQKKMENTLKQNEFLLNFVSNLSSSYTKKELREMSKRYNWMIHFPVILAIFSIKEKNVNTINPSLLNYMRTLIMNEFDVHSQELRYAYLNERLLFIINTSSALNNYNVFQTIYTKLKGKYHNIQFKIIFSNNINEVKDISKTYFLLSESLVHIENKNLNTIILTEYNAEILNLLKNIDYSNLKNYVTKTLNPLITYELKNNVPLIDTLYTHIECKFNAKVSSKELFIHYNSLRHRLSIIKDLGYDLPNSVNHFDLYFALYLYKNFGL